MILRLLNRAILVEACKDRLIRAAQDNHKIWRQYAQQSDCICWWL